MLDATTLLLGLPRLQVVNVTRQGDGTRIVDAVTDDCPGARFSPPPESSRQRPHRKTSPTVMNESFCVGTRLDVEKTTVSAEPSPTPSSRYLLGLGPPAKASQPHGFCDR